MKRLMLLAACAALAPPLFAQPAPRRATNLASVLAYPAFYHSRPVTLQALLKVPDTGKLTLADEGGSLRVIFSGSAPEGRVEARGEFWDLGRMKPDDPRLVAMDLRATFGVDRDAAWPKAGEVLALLASSVTTAEPAMAPSIRTIVLDPLRYADQRVTLKGQFGGRNLFGDLPISPGRSKWDFVIRSGDAAIWVTGAKPKGKGFELALDARRDTSVWLEVSGLVRQVHGLQWLEASQDSLVLSKPLAAAPEETPAEKGPSAPPPEVVFSAPTEDETDVSLTTSVRIQFQRDINPATLKGNIKANYFEQQTRERGEPVTPTADFTTQYNSAARVLEIRFVRPLERFRLLKIELSDAVLGTDGQHLKPWTLTFALGGS